MQQRELYRVTAKTVYNGSQEIEFTVAPFCSAGDKIEKNFTNNSHYTENYP